jgi:hypothetical protein
MVIGRAKGSSKDARRIPEGSSKDERQWLPAAFIKVRPRMSFIEVHARLPEEARISFHHKVVLDLGGLRDLRGLF